MGEEYFKTKAAVIKYERFLLKVRDVSLYMSIQYLLTTLY